ncbi:MAG: efflux transporter outer membrane subunit [Ignavibacteria bacterium]|nr:efflux transporter outer membrane subunit [Ignavibacteria bacterium]
MNPGRHIRFVLIGMIFFPAACAIGPDYQRPELETPQQYRTDSTIVFADSSIADSLLNLKWWDLFGDPVLDTLVRIALDENKDVLIAASRIEEARATYGFTKADIFPRLDISAGASRGDFVFGNKAESLTNNFFIAPTLSWEIDFWGKFRRANESARADLLASMSSLRTIQLSLISEVVGSYFFLLDYKRRLEISERTLESRIVSLDIIQKRFDKGIIPEIDLNQAQIQKEIAEGAIPLHRRLVSQTENSLSILLGRLPSSVPVASEIDQLKVPEIPMGIPATILERRPDIAEAEFRVMSQNAKIGVAQAMRLPSISLTGIFGFASGDLSNLISDGAAWSLGGDLFGPIFNFGKNIARVEIEEERTKQTLYLYEKTVLLAFADVEDALTEVKTYGEQLSSVERKLVAARNAAYLSRERYDKGVTSYLEVLDTERSLFSIELELSEVNQQYHNAYVRLYKALGGGWLSEEEMEEAARREE